MSKNKDILIESPNGDRIYASEKAFNIIYKELYNYKRVEDESIIKDSPIMPQEVIKEENIDNNKTEKPKQRRRPKNNGGE